MLPSSRKNDVAIIALDSGPVQSVFATPWPSRHPVQGESLDCHPCVLSPDGCLLVSAGLGTDPTESQRGCLCMRAVAHVERSSCARLTRCSKSEESRSSRSPRRTITVVRRPRGGTPRARDPYEITTGSDGALWFTNHGNSSIGRITTAGVVTNYTDPSIAGPEGIAAGSDGALWFTNIESGQSGTIGRITTAGAVTSYPIPADNSCPCHPEAITGGPDGDLWFTYDGTSEGAIGRITTTGGVSFTETDDDVQSENITSGSDGALWFTTLGNSLQRITTAGVITNTYSYYAGESSSGIAYPSLYLPFRIAPGPDGALWITADTSIVRFTTAVTPEIGDFTPKSGGVATTVTIDGHNLAGATQVTFKGVVATIVSDTARTVVVTVPDGATTGQISITTAAGTATSSGTFSVT